MNRQQNKHLQERLRDAERAKDNRFSLVPEEDKPANVRNAERVLRAHQAIINQWRQRRDRINELAYKAMMKRSTKVRELILFGDPDKALAALHVFEASEK